MIVRPFKALRATPQSAQKVASVPYDVVDFHEASTLASGNPLSFLRVLRAEIDLDAKINPHDPKVYQQAARNLEQLRTQGHLVCEEQPCLYVYRITMGEHVQTGLLACCSLDEYETGIVKKHELTRKDKEDDRTQHILSCRAQTGPVLVAYRDVEAVDALLAREVEKPPLLTSVSETDVKHEIFGVTRTNAVVEAFQDVPTAYIADGHHRAASAARARQDLRSQNRNHTGREEYNYFLTVIFPASQTKILAYNRLVRDLGDLTPEDLLNRATGKFDISLAASAVPAQAGQFCMYLSGQWHRLLVKPHLIDQHDAVSSLDCSLLQDYLLEPILGIQDVRTDPRISSVGGAHGTDLLQQKVDSKEAAAAFSLYPTSIEQLMAVADTGQVMPPKSTWFEPKLRSGLVVHVV